MSRIWKPGNEWRNLGRKWQHSALLIRHRRLIFIIFHMLRSMALVVISLLFLAQVCELLAVCEREALGVVVSRVWLLPALGAVVGSGSLGTTGETQPGSHNTLMRNTMHNALGNTMHNAKEIHLRSKQFKIHKWIF